jgi:hypothetical protein
VWLIAGDLLSSALVHVEVWSKTPFGDSSTFWNTSLIYPEEVVIHQIVLEVLGANVWWSCRFHRGVSVSQTFFGEPNWKGNHLHSEHLLNLLHTTQDTISSWNRSKIKLVIFLNRSWKKFLTFLPHQVEAVLRVGNIGPLFLNCRFFTFLGEVINFLLLVSSFTSISFSDPLMFI